MKYIISDVDGCLTGEESEPFDLPTLDRIARWARRSAAGGEGLPLLTLCTGRPQPYVEALAKLFAISLPVICENGAVIYTLADNRARFARGATAEKRAGLHRLQEHLVANVLPDFPEAVLQFGKMAHLSIYSTNHDRLLELAPIVEAFVRTTGGPELDVNTSHFYLNVSLKGVSKGAAIEELVEELGAPREELAGIGDTEGDLSIREAVGFFACPSNARPAIKAVADFVATKPKGEGVLEILGHIAQLR